MNEIILNHSSSRFHKYHDLIIKQIKKDKNNYKPYKTTCCGHSNKPKSVAKRKVSMD